MTADKYSGFEQGPIRPPSEAGSLLIRVTRNCPWNRCAFCPVYKGKSFSRRPVDHVLRDIDTVHGHVKDILRAQRHDSRIAYSAFMDLMQEDGADRRALHAARHFVANGMRSVFLQDANSLIVKSDGLVRILEHLTAAFPTVERITSYARSSTLDRIRPENLERIARAGLSRIHVGMESGSDRVLAMVDKGVDKATQIRAGQKVKQAGMELSEYHIPGLGGRGAWQDHALQTADALNRINPDFIRLRTLALPHGAPLSDRAKAGRFKKQGEVETVRELLLFLESLDGITSTVTSDHMLNLFPEVKGELPRDREAMLAPLREFLALDPYEQMLYCLGRRGLALERLQDLQDPVLRKKAEKICRRTGAGLENMDAVIDRMMMDFVLDAGPPVPLE